MREVFRTEAILGRTSREVQPHRILDRTPLLFESKNKSQVYDMRQIIDCLTAIMTLRETFIPRQFVN